MREATERILDSRSCEEAWIRLVNLGVQDVKCKEYFKADGGLMAVLVCDGAESQGLGPWNTSLPKLSESTH